MQTSEVAAVHDELPQAAPPTYAVAVSSVEKKFRPETVTVVSPLDALLTVETNEEAGESNEKARCAVPTMDRRAVTDFGPLPVTAVAEH